MLTTPSTGQAGTPCLASIPTLCNERFGRDFQLAIEAANHGKAQPAFPIEHFVDPVQIADVRLHIAGRQTGLLHAKLDRFDQIGQIERGMRGFVAFDQGREDFEPVPFRRAGSRVGVDQGRYDVQGLVVVVFVVKSGGFPYWLLPLYSFRIDPVVLTVSADELDVDELDVDDADAVPRDGSMHRMRTHVRCLKTPRGHEAQERPRAPHAPAALVAAASSPMAAAPRQCDPNRAIA